MADVPEALLERRPSVLLLVDEDHRDLLDHGSVSLLAMYDVRSEMIDAPTDFPVLRSITAATQHYCDGHRWTCEHWRRGDLEAAAGVLEQVAADDWRISIADVHLLERVYRATPILGRTWHQSWCRQLALSCLHAHAARALARKAAHVVEVATVLLTRGDVAAAAIAARVASEHVVDALLAGAGRLMTEPHGRCRALREIPAGGLPVARLVDVDWFWDVQRMTSYTEADGPSWVEAVLGTCLTALAAIESAEIVSDLCELAEGKR